MSQNMAGMDVGSSRARDSYDLGELAGFVLKGCHEGIAVLDKAMCYLFVNDQYLSDYRIDDTNLIGKCHYDVFPEIPERWKTIHRNVLAGRTERACEDRFVRADGTVDYLWWECRPWYHDRGKIGGMILYTKVVTNQKLMEDEIRRSRDELEVRVKERTSQLQKANEDLEASMRERDRWERELGEAKLQAEIYLDLLSHDVSNMHQIILGYLETAEDLMQRKGRLEGADREVIDASMQTLQRSARLIKNVRNLQKLKAGEYKPVRVDLGEALSGVVSLYSGLPGQEVRISYSPVKNHYVLANSLLKDVFENLLDNAIKHGEAPVRIWITVNPVCHTERLFYQVVVEDNGPGIPDERKATVFKRLKSDRSLAKGTGLGLYFVRSLVESFGGSIMVQDRVQGNHTRGAKFVVLLPVAHP